MARSLKNGKISVKLPRDTQVAVVKAIQIRLELDELPHYLEYLLQEAVEKLQGESCQLRKSEFFALFHPDNMIYIDDPTQLLIREAVQLEEQTIAPLIPTASTPFIAPTPHENIAI